MDSKDLIMKVSDLLEKVGVKQALKSPEVVETIYNVMSKNGMKVDKAMFTIVMMGIANSDKIDIGALLNLGSGLLGATNAQPSTATAQPNAANALGALGALGAIAGAMGNAQPAAAATATQPAAPTSNASNAANMLGALGALGAIAGAVGNAQGNAQQQAAQPKAQPATGAANVGDALNAIAGIANALNATKK